MIRLKKYVRFIADRFNWISAIAIVMMMLLTSADVLLRLFIAPIPGVYEMVGLLGCIVISFSLGYTSSEKGHIAVEFLVQKLPDSVQHSINIVNNLLSMFLFGLITWQCIVYASDLKLTGEVSLTLQMPIYPFVYGISIGCGLLCLVLAADFLQSLGRIIER